MRVKCLQPQEALMTDYDVIELVIAECRHAPNPVFVRAILAALADDGRVIVPEEPTQGMALAGLAAGGKTDTLADIYRAMIAAGGDDD